LCYPAGRIVLDDLQGRVGYTVSDVVGRYGKTEVAVVIVVKIEQVMMNNL